MEDELYGLIRAIEEKFGTSFKDFQVAAYKKALCGKDTIIVAPTGSGKTHCFAFLSEIFDLQDKQKKRTEAGASVQPDNVVVVISPLSGLLVEQTERLISFGVNAAFLGELQTDETVKSSVLNGNASALFITPDSVLESKWRKVLASSRYNKKIRAVVIDEAHCISHW